MNFTQVELEELRQETIQDGLDLGFSPERAQASADRAIRALTETQEEESGD